ncbi:MAG: tetratricopeptide repeat protein, partial [Chloroflexota bacterium]
SQARMLRGMAGVWGPLPAAEVIQLVEGGVARGAVARARMLALQGRFAEAQVVVAQASQSLAELGDRIGLSICHEVAGLVARLSGDSGEAVRNLQLSYDELIALGDQAFASTRAGFLAEAYLEAQELDEAWQYAGIARDTSASDDIASQSLGRRIQARVLSARGQHAEAEALAREAVAIMGRTDYLVMHGDALVHLGQVLYAAGKVDEAVAAAREAVELYDRKGATFLAERTRELLEEWRREAGR